VNRSASLILLGVLAFSAPCLGQGGVSDHQRPGVPDKGQRPASPAMAEMQERQRQERERRRYEDMKRDTDRLLQLATDLKLHVDKAGQHTLSLEVIRKTDEIEKLARSVRAKMRAE